MFERLKGSEKKRRKGEKKGEKKNMAVGMGTEGKERDD